MTDSESMRARLSAQDRLDAAAPELLEALKFGLFSLDCYGPVRNTTPGWEKKFRQDARAAIAKAEAVRNDKAEAV